MHPFKDNVNKFNKDIKENNGYQYTTNANFSSIVSNKRITDEISKLISANTETIIDIGCGDGTYTNELSRFFKNTIFLGIDPASEAINIAKRNYSNIHFHVADILNTDSLPRKKFTVGILRGVLHHLPDAYKGLENSAILSDKLIILEPNGNNPILKLIEKKSTYHIEHEEQSFNSKELLNWVEKINFKIVKINYIGFVPFFFPTIPAKIIYFFQPLLELIYPLKKYFAAQIVILCEKK